MYHQKNWMVDDCRSESEKKFHDLLNEILDVLADGKKVGRVRFTEMLGHITVAKSNLDNKQRGCWSGKHSSYCTCTQAHEGRSTDPWGRLNT